MREDPFYIHFLNLDYLFYQLFRFLRFVFGTVDYYVFGGALGSGYMPGGTVSSGTYDYFGVDPAAYGGFFGVSRSEISAFFATLVAALIIALMFVFAYSVIRLMELRKRENELLASVVDIGPEPTPRNDQWEKVLERVNSMHPAEWKLAILEADTMLDDMVRRMGYRGENLGERLKVVEPSDFQSIQSAWEAHKMRNRIAHEGSEFELSQREARRIVGLYEQVFREFFYI